MTSYNYFKIRRKVDALTYEIANEKQESSEEIIEVAEILPARTIDNKPTQILTTEQGRTFARVEDWPKDTILELKP